MHHFLGLWPESLRHGWEGPGLPSLAVSRVRGASCDAVSSSYGLFQILVANDKACGLLGYSSHDLIGQKLVQFFVQPDSEVAEALSEEHVEADGHAAVVFGTVVSRHGRALARIHG